jgi:hypothetical protein
MYKVEVVNECSCFLKSGMSNYEEFESEIDAKKFAEKIVTEMKLYSCKRDSISINRFLNTFKVVISR